MTLREELDGIAAELEEARSALPSQTYCTVYKRGPGLGVTFRDGLAALVARLNALVARCAEAEKPAEPAPAPAPLPQAVASVISQLRDLSENVARGYYPHQPELGDTIASLADRLAESVPGGAEEGAGRLMPETQAEIADILQPFCEAANLAGDEDCGYAAVLRRLVALSGAAASGAGAGEDAARAIRSALSFADNLEHSSHCACADDATSAADSTRCDCCLADLIARLRRAEAGVRLAFSAPSAEGRRCLCCNLLNPGSEVCPATQSGKHVMEAEADSAETRSDHGNASLLDAADGARQWLLHMQEWVKQYDCPTHGELCGRWAENLRLAAERESNAPAIESCPEVAELKEVIRVIAKEAAREEVASALARLMKPAPEEHVAPDTSGTRRKP